MTDISKQTKPAQEVAAKEPKKTSGALEDKQLDTVTGGKAGAVLSSACATGVHFKDATITH